MVIHVSWLIRTISLGYLHSACILHNTTDFGEKTFIKIQKKIHVLKFSGMLFGVELNLKQYCLALN